MKVARFLELSVLQCVCQCFRSVVKLGLRVSQIKSSNCFRRLEKLVLP